MAPREWVRPVTESKRYIQIVRDGQVLPRAERKKGQEFIGCLVVADDGEILDGVQWDLQLLEKIIEKARKRGDSEVLMARDLLSIGNDARDLVGKRIREALIRRDKAARQGFPTEAALVAFFCTGSNQFLSDGKHGHGWSVASTEEVATAFKIDPKVAYRGLAKLARSGFLERGPMRMEVGRTIGRGRPKEVGWQTWEYHYRKDNPHFEPAS